MTVRSANKLCWMIGGPQGSGVDSAATIFTRACASGGMYVFGKREYYSNIMGEHSYFQVRVDEKPIQSSLDHVDLLACLDAETIVRHFSEVNPGGGIIFDSTHAAMKATSIPTLEHRLVADLEKFLTAEGVGDTVEELLNYAKGRGVVLYPMPYQTLLAEVGKKIGESHLSRLARIVNTMAVSASFALVGFNRDLVKEAVMSTFKAKPRVAETNVLTVDLAYDYAKTNFGEGLPRLLSPVSVKEPRMLMQGTHALALGKMLGGCRFQTYYPITPATDESEFLEAHEKLPLESVSGPTTAGMMVVQCEDEIAAVTMASGAALTGCRASTSTSGPGFSLMVEGLGWAGINEVPLVITYYQRAGPSTGLPTRHEQGDLRFAVHAGHGEFPRFVVASGDIKECFEDAVQCFNYAERFQLPVIHMVDKALANTTCVCREFPTADIRIQRGELLDDAALANFVDTAGPYKRFALTPTGISPRVGLGAKDAVFWNTGDEHDELGHITEDPVIRTVMMEKRMRKLEAALAAIPEDEKFNFYGEEGAEATVVSWGSPKGAILEAIEALKGEDVNVNFLQIRFIHPFPSNSVSRILSKAKKIIDVEMNYSAQLAGIIAEETLLKVDACILKYNGRPMTFDEVHHSIKDIVRGKTAGRVVLTHGS
ncbi:MAG: 2-oxoacid:ferredoxin oxidoreductase subunit alpha [Candidatus Bathyarchaeia archaeon]